MDSDHQTKVKTKMSGNNYISVCPWWYSQVPYVSPNSLDNTIICQCSCSSDISYQYHTTRSSRSIKTI